MTDPIEDLLEDWKRERPELDAAPMGVVGRVLRLGKQWEQRAAHLLRDYGLGVGEFDVLATLRRQGKPYELSPSQLSRAAMLTTGGMTNMLDRLERRGWIERRPNPADRRGTMVRLRPKGRKLVERAIGPRLEDAGESLTHLTATERKRLAALLSKLLDSGSARD